MYVHMFPQLCIIVLIAHALAPTPTACALSDARRRGGAQAHVSPQELPGCSWQTGYKMNAKDWYLLGVAFVYMAAFSSLYTQVPGEWRGLTRVQLCM